VSAPEFSVGEYVERRLDGKVGVVKKVQPYEGDFAFYVNFRDDLTDETWAGTTVAWRRHFRWHAHVTTSSRDCDGDYSGGHVVEMTLSERCDQFGEIHFKERVIGDTISVYGHGILNVAPEQVSWHEQTEEGYSAADVRWCEDDCPDTRSWQRDHRAEEAGY